MHAIPSGPNGTNRVDIGTTLPGLSVGTGSNASGQVVGIFGDTRSGAVVMRDFVTDANGANATLLDALLGQAAAEAVTPTGRRAFLLTPVPVPAALRLFTRALVALFVEAPRSAAPNPLPVSAY